MPTSTQNAHAIYVYGFIAMPLGHPQHAMPLLGVDAQYPICVHSHAGLNVLVSWVELADFTGEVGENNLQNVGWITPRACRHAAVIDHFRQQTTVYPLSFGTLFSSLETLEQEICYRVPAILAALEHIADCQEWSLEVTLNRAQAVEILFNEGVENGRFLLPDSMGRRHLEEQKLRRQVQSELNHWLEGCLIAWQTELQSFARDFRSRRCTDDKILHWVFLITQANDRLFHETLAAFREHYQRYGFQFRITGPWAAYSFCQKAHR